LTIRLRFPRARGGAERRAESGPSFGPRRRRFHFDFIEGGERWRAAPVAAALELGGRLRKHHDRNSTARAHVLRTHTARYGVQVAIAGKLETVCPTHQHVVATGCWRSLPPSSAAAANLPKRKSPAPQSNVRPGFAAAPPMDKEHDPASLKCQRASTAETITMPMLSRSGCWRSLPPSSTPPRPTMNLSKGNRQHRGPKLGPDSARRSAPPRARVQRTKKSKRAPQ